MATPQAGLSYVIDRDDIVVRVDEAWTAFANENGGQAFAEQTVGRSVWDFVSGSTTRQIYRDLLVRVRLGSEVRFAFRCDAPHCLRRMTMTMTPLQQSRVRFSTAVIGVVPIVGLERYAPAPITGVIRMCSWCKSIAVGDEWQECETGITKLGLFSPENRAAITHGICPNCAADIDTELRRTEHSHPASRRA